MSGVDTSRETTSAASTATSASVSATSMQTASLTQRERAFVQSRQFRERCLRNSLMASDKDRERPHITSAKQQDQDDEDKEKDKPATSGACDGEEKEEEEEDVFAFGNTTVLHWGRVECREGFYSSTQLFPLGFTAVRYEIDTVLESIVELLCEIDGVLTVSDGEREGDALVNADLSLAHTTSTGSGSPAVPRETHTVLYSRAVERGELSSLESRNAVVQIAPLFRITARWHIAPQQQRSVVRVYEGRSAQQVWQAAMMESVGLEDEEEILLCNEEDEEEEDEENELDEMDSEEERERTRERPAKRERETKREKKRARAEHDDDGAANGSDNGSLANDEDEEIEIEKNAMEIERVTEDEDSEREREREKARKRASERDRERADDARELSLRQRVFEQRRDFFRLMRQAQREGAKHAIRPRLSLEQIDNFFDATLLKCVEGLVSPVAALRCAEYVPLSERSTAAANTTRAHNDYIQRDYAAMEQRVKDLQRVSRRLDLLDAQSKQTALRQSKLEEQELRKRTQFAAKEIRALTHAAQKSRAQRLKELEKSALAGKAARLKVGKKRREELRSSSGSAGTTAADAFADALRTRHANALLRSTELLESTELLRAPRPPPCERALCGVDDTYVAACQLWQFLCVCGDAQWRGAERVSLDDVLGALRAWHPRRAALLALSLHERECVRETERETHTRLAQRLRAERGLSLAALNEIGAAVVACVKRSVELLYGAETLYTPPPPLRSPSQPALTTTATSSSAATANTPSAVPPPLSSVPPPLVYLPINALTWKEFARTLYLAEALRSDVSRATELSLSTESELGPWLRGKTSLSWDAHDKKFLKLARLRITHQWRYSSEVEEAVSPWHAGYGVSLSVPTSLSSAYDPAQCERDARRDLSVLCEALRDMLCVCVERERCVGGNNSDCDGNGNTEREFVGEREAQRVCVCGRESALWSVSDIQRSVVRRFRSLCLCEERERALTAALREIESGRCSLSRSLAVLAPLCVRESNNVLTTTHSTPSHNMLSQRAVDSDNDDNDDPVVRARCEAAQASMSRRALCERCVVLTQALLAHNVVATLSSEREWNALAALQSRLERDAAALAAWERERDRERVCETHTLPTHDPLSQQRESSLTEMDIVERESETHTTPSHNATRSTRPVTLSLCEVFDRVTLCMSALCARHPEGTPSHPAVQRLCCAFQRIFLETVLCCDAPLLDTQACLLCRGAVSACDAHTQSHTQPSHTQTQPLSQPHVVCERCEGCFHVSCLDSPPPIVPLRGEGGGWFCPFCVEQRGVSSAHPLRCARVYHPTELMTVEEEVEEREGERAVAGVTVATTPTADEVHGSKTAENHYRSGVRKVRRVVQTRVCGEVVGIERTSDALVFVVHFPGGGERERWRGAESVLQQLAPRVAQREDFLWNSLSPQRERETHTQRCAGLSLTHCGERECASVSHTMCERESEIDWRDYDAACMRAAGFSDWGLSETSAALALSLSLCEKPPSHNALSKSAEHSLPSPLPTQSRCSPHNALSQRTRAQALRVLCALGRGERCESALSGGDWAAVLRGLTLFYSHSDPLPPLSLAHTQSQAQALSQTQRETERESDEVSVSVSHNSLSQCPVSPSPSLNAVTQPTQPARLTQQCVEEELSLMAALRGAEDAIAAHETLCELLSPHREREGETENGSGTENNLNETENPNGTENNSSGTIKTKTERTTETEKVEIDPLEGPVVSAEPAAVRALLGEFSLSAGLALRGALSRPPEHVSHCDAWCAAFCEKLISLCERDSEREKEREEVVWERCVVCGLTERDLCHPLVDVSQDELSVGLTLPHNSQSLPHNALTQPAPTMKMHHCCRVALSQSLSLSRERCEREELAQAVELLSHGADGAHGACVGVDRHGALYFVLYCGRGVLVCETERYCERDGVCDNVVDTHHLTHSCRSLNTLSQRPPVRYTVYRTPQEVRSLTAWLQPLHPAERRLHRALSLWAAQHASQLALTTRETSLNALSQDVLSSPHNALSQRIATPAQKEKESERDSFSESLSLTLSAVRDALCDSAERRRAARRPLCVGESVCVLSRSESATHWWDGVVRAVRCVERDAPLDAATQHTLSHTDTPSYERDREQRVVSAGCVYHYCVALHDVVSLRERDRERWVCDVDVCAREGDCGSLLVRVRERESASLSLSLSRTAGDALRTLHAHRHVRATQRVVSDAVVGLASRLVCGLSLLLSEESESVCGVQHGVQHIGVQHSCETAELALLKRAMLLVLCALPAGCLDESDDKWGAPLNALLQQGGNVTGTPSASWTTVWATSVSLATDASALIHCLVVLEYSLKTAWMKPIGLKTLSSLPSRGHALRNATVGSVALRLWVLDQCVRYEKVVEPKAVAVKESKSKSKKR